MNNEFVSKIDLTRGLNINPIPLEFSNSVTTTEWLCALQSKINECVEYVNTVLSRTNTYTDDCILEVNENIQKQVSNITKMIQQSIEHAREEYILNLQNSVTDLNMTINRLNDNLRMYTNSKCDTIQNDVNTKYEEIMTILQEQGKLLVCPADGNLETMQQILHHLFDLFRNNSLTVAEFDALELTATEIDAFELNVKQFDNNSNQLAN